MAIERCVEIRRASGDLKKLAVSLNNLANLHNETGNIVLALDIHSQSLRLREQVNDEKGRSVSLISIANIYMKQGQNEKALEYFLKCYEIRKNSKDKKSVSNVLFSLAAIHEQLGKNELAEKYLNESAAISFEIGDKEGLARIYGAKAKRASKAKSYDSAFVNYSRSLALYESMGEKKEHSKTLSNIGMLHLKLKQYSEAMKYSEKALKLAQEIKNIDVMNMSAKTLYLTSKRERSFKKAVEMFRLHTKLQDSLVNNETRKASLNSQLKYEYERQIIADSAARAKEFEMKNNLLTTRRAEIKAKKDQEYLLLSGLGLVLLFLVFMYNRDKVTKRQNHEIELQNEEVEKQKALIEQKQKEIIDSINYAKKIQMALMPNELKLNNIFKKLSR